METLSFWLHAFALIAMLALTWLMIHGYKNHGGFIYFLVLGIVFPCFVVVAGDFFNIITNPPTSDLHLLVSGIVWIAFVVVTSYVPYKKKVVHVNSL